MVARKDYLFAGRMEERRPVGFPEARDLFQVAAVHIAGIDLHVRRCHKSLFEQVGVLFLFLFGGWSRRTEDKLLPVGRKKSTTVIPQTVSDLLLTASVGVH